MKHSHEASLPVLRSLRARGIVDYDYALVHLFDNNKIGEEYFEYFEGSLDSGIEVILDNSIFELNTSFDPGRFATYVEKLKPTMYVIPDVLEESEETINLFEEFTASYGNLPGAKIGVVQGKNYDELKECYMFMATFADVIAISYDYSYYNTIGEAYWNNENVHSKRAFGRPNLISQFIADGIFCYSKPHHLLGSALDSECLFYKDLPQIHSIDTSNPVWAGINNCEYIKEWGMLKDKPYDSSQIKMCDLIADNYMPDNEAYKRIISNVQTFRKLAKGI